MLSRRRFLSHSCGLGAFGMASATLGSSLLQLGLARRASAQIGDYKALVCILLAGGNGVISVIGGGFPAAFSKMVRLGLAGNASEAYALHYALMEGIDLIFEEGNPAGIKAVLKKLKLAEDTVRLPLVKAGGALQEKISGFTDHFR